MWSIRHRFTLIPLCVVKGVTEIHKEVVANTPTKAANVVDEDGTTIGSITLDQVIAGLSRPDVVENSEPRYR